MATVIQIGESVFIQPDAATIREQSVQAEVSRWPVEDGAEVADHTIVHNRRWSADLIFSEQPIGSNLGPAAGELRPDRAFALLEAAAINRTLCGVTAPGNLLEDLVLTSVSSPQTLADGYTRRIRIEAEQVRFARAEEENVAGYLAMLARIRHAATMRRYNALRDEFAKDALIAAAAVDYQVPDGVPTTSAARAIGNLLGIEVQ